MDKIFQLISKILLWALGLMVACILWNIICCYIIPEIQEGEISFRPKGWQYESTGVSR